MLGVVIASINDSMVDFGCGYAILLPRRSNNTSTPARQAIIPKIFPGELLFVVILGKGDFSKELRMKNVISGSKKLQLLLVSNLLMSSGQIRQNPRFHELFSFVVPFLCFCALTFGMLVWGAGNSKSTLHPIHISYQKGSIQPYERWQKLITKNHANLDQVCISFLRVSHDTWQSNDKRSQWISIRSSSGC